MKIYESPVAVEQYLEKPKVQNRGISYRSFRLTKVILSVPKVKLLRSQGSLSHNFTPILLPSGALPHSIKCWFSVIVPPALCEDQQ